MLRVSEKTKRNRRTTCDACEYYAKKSGTCGTPILGNKVQHEGKEVKLCGCFMNIKTLLKTSACPIGRWKAEVKKADLEEMREIMKDIPSVLSGQQVTEIHKLWSIATGLPRKRTHCAACVRQMVQEIKQFIASEDDE
tara:strand:+ start:6949 stop:7362 length:414 start_codon:yes stop_codon:yes gene_type:complete